MATNPIFGFVAVSHTRNELHVSNEIEEHQPPTRQLTVVKLCRVCGDEIGHKDNGELFVACHECGLPVCCPCYEYKRSERNQCCPGCDTRYKRQKGCHRVAGDEEDNFDDDFEDEFQIKNHYEDTKISIMSLLAC